MLLIAEYPGDLPWLSLDLIMPSDQFMQYGLMKSARD